MYTYLQNEAYYVDLYDLLTIQDCLRTEVIYQNKYNELYPKKRTKKEKVDLIKAMKLAHVLYLYTIKGEHYSNKSTTIRDWMNRDRLRDEKVTTATPPTPISCPSCFTHMEVNDKHLHTEGSNERVLFMFECKRCDKRKAVFDNGEEYKPRLHLCPKCSRELRASHIRKEGIVTSKFMCSKCKYVETEIIDFAKDEKEWAKQKQQDKKLLSEYRIIYCLSDQEGQEYIASKVRMKILQETITEEERKKSDPSYQKALKLKKLTIVELEKYLLKHLQKAQFSSLSFDKPEIEKHVIVPFTVRDNSSSRNKRESEYGLKKLMKKTLEQTNWRLMSDGVSYRLGYLSGRLKGYENEEDLINIIKQ